LRVSRANFFWIFYFIFLKLDFQGGFWGFSTAFLGLDF
jgi:hypothetical protein